MALVLLSLVLVVQSPIISASGSWEHRKACVTYHISALYDSSQELFYIDGTLVDKYFFCNAIRINLANHCFITGNVRTRYCGLGFSLGMLHQIYIDICFPSQSICMMIPRKKLSIIYEILHLSVLSQMSGLWGREENF